MPQVPVYGGGAPTIDRQVAPAVRPVGLGVADTSGLTQGLGQAAQALGNVAQNMSSRALEARVKELDIETADAFRSILNDPQNGYFAKQGRNAIDAYEPTRAALEKTIQSRAEAMSDGALKSAYLDVANRRLEAAFNGINTHAMRANQEWQNQTSEARVSAARNDAVANSSDPGQAALHLNTAMVEIDDLGARNGWAPEYTAEKKREVRADYARGALEMMPIARRVESLMAPAEGSPFAAIPADERAALLDRMQTKLLADRRAAQVEHDRAVKLRGEDALREAYAMADENRLTLDYVEDNREFFSPSEYKALRRTLRGGEGFDDPEAISDLTRSLDVLEPSEFERNAARYLLEGRLEASTYRTMVGQSRSFFADRSPANPYKAGREVIKGTLDPGQFLSGPAAAIYRQAQFGALSEFDAWMRANPDADHVAVSEQARDIIKRTQVIPFEQMKLALGASRYFDGKTRDEITLEDVEQAELRLLGDVESGVLSMEQSELEARRLADWRLILIKGLSGKETGNER